MMNSYKLSKCFCFLIITMKLFVLCTLVTAAYSLSLEGEGVPTKNVSGLNLRIFNGHEAKIGQFPWQAYLTIHFNSGFSKYCGGSLIHNQWVLTAKHCLLHRDLITTYIIILLGTIDVANANEEVSTNSSKYYIYEDDNHYYDDIGLVKLNKAVKYTKNVRAIALGKQPLPGSHVRVSGFGTTQDGVSNTKLYYTDLIIMEEQECKKAVGYYEPLYQVCGKSVRGSPCSGDSGSPVVMQENGIWKQFGVHHGGLHESCQEDTSIFIPISHCHNWILEEIRVHK